ATSIGFGTQVINTTSSSKTLTITNTGSAGITISGITADMPFSQTNNCSSLAANASCTANISFVPASTGLVNAFLTIQYSGTQTKVNLNGIGTAFSVPPQSGSPASATITAGQTATYNLSVGGSNFFTGNVNLSCNGAPAQSNCSLSSSALTLNGSTPAN